MNRFRRSNILLAAGIALVVPASVASAVPTTVVAQDTPHCDPLMNMSFVHELGDAPVFPLNELIFSSSIMTPQVACPSHDNPNFPNTEVRIVNLSGLFWTDLHYVADPATAAAPGTTISNEDGLVNGGQAFRIDTVGVNTPLILESMTPNGIFEPLETWVFIIDDYSHGTGAAATPFDSIGVGFGSISFPPSTGSIIASEVPEPGAISLAGLVAAGALYRRRR